MSAAEKPDGFTADRLRPSEPRRTQRPEPWTTERQSGCSCPSGIAHAQILPRSEATCNGIAWIRPPSGGDSVRDDGRPSVRSATWMRSAALDGASGRVRVWESAWPASRRRSVIRRCGRPISCACSSASQRRQGVSCRSRSEPQRPPLVSRTLPQPGDRCKVRHASIHSCCPPGRRLAALAECGEAGAMGRRRWPMAPLTTNRGGRAPALGVGARGCHAPSVEPRRPIAAVRRRHLPACAVMKLLATPDMSVQASTFVPKNRKVILC